ncbi:hypothetical protein BDW62DRAFT_198724 [Aspergillus aurantiobrunneus]
MGFLSLPTKLHNILHLLAPNRKDELEVLVPIRHSTSLNPILTSNKPNNRPQPQPNLTRRRLQSVRRYLIHGPEWKKEIFIEIPSKIPVATVLVFFCARSREEDLEYRDENISSM